MSEVCIRLEWQIQNVLDNELEEEEKEFLAAQKIDGESEGALPVYLVGRLRVKFCYAHRLRVMPSVQPPSKVTVPFADGTQSSSKAVIVKVSFSN
jgi:hypothetical protein